MSLKLKMCRTQCVLALLALYVGLAHSWDIAVSYGDELKFYTNTNLINTIKFESQTLTALAYDVVHNRILYVDKQTNGDAICGYTISSIENICYTERTGRNIHGIAFDPATETVFFTDTNERTVNWFSLKPGSQNNARGNLLIQMYEGIPRDIIVDSCKRHVYWLNTDMTNPTIERARFAGTEREVFQTLTTLYIDANYKMEPNSITIDPLTQEIYWFEPWNTTQYRCFTLSVLKTTQKRAVFYHNQAAPPVFIHPSNTLAVTNRAVYHVDSRRIGANVYVLGKEFIHGHVAELIEHNGANKMIPVGIVANYQISEQNQDCEVF